MNDPEEKGLLREFWVELFWVALIATFFGTFCFHKGRESMQALSLIPPV